MARLGDTRAELIAERQDTARLRAENARLRDGLAMLTVLLDDDLEAAERWLARRRAALRQAKDVLYDHAAP